MATTLPFGLVRPDDGDKGQAVFDPLEANITQLDGHAHGGTDSARISAGNLSRSEVDVDGTGWSADGEFFKKTVTFPASHNVADGSEFGQASIRFYYDGGTNDGNELFPKTVKLTSTTFELHSISSSQAYKVLFV